MKMPLLITIAGLAIGFAVPTLAQQKDTITDPQIVQQLHASGKKTEEAFLKGDAAARAALFTEDAVLVNDSGPVYGRQSIEQYYTDLFKKVHYLSFTVTYDPHSPHAIGTNGNAAWENGQWSGTIKEGEGSPPRQLKGYWAAVKVREGDTWKLRMVTANVTPAPAASPSPTATPSNQ